MAKLQALTLEDLVAIKEGFFNGMNMNNANEIRALEAIREAITIAERYHPREYICLANAVQLRGARSERRARAKKMEETLQQYGFSIRPDREFNKITRWNVGIGDLLDPANETICRDRYLKEAVAAAVAKELQRRAANGNDKAPQDLVDLCLR